MKRRSFRLRLGRNKEDGDTRNPNRIADEPERCSASNTASKAWNGPVCVDDFLEMEPPVTPKLQPSYFTSAVTIDLDHNDSSGCFPSLETSSSSSTDDSYQADLHGKKRVSFSQVSMRIFSVTVSDSPNPSSTYPMGLDWKYEDTESIDLESFEETKSNDTGVHLRGFRRPKRLSPLDRFHRISELSGLSPGEIYELEHARSSRQPRQLPPESSISNVSSKKKNPYQVVDVDSGYHCVDV